MKEQALIEVFNIDKQNTANTQVTGQTKMKFVPVYNAEQQVLILGLLRFRVLSPQHFKVVFGEQAISEYDPFKDCESVQKHGQIEIEDDNIFGKMDD